MTTFLFLTEGSQITAEGDNSTDSLLPGLVIGLIIGIVLSVTLILGLVVYKQITANRRRVVDSVNPY